MITHKDRVVALIDGDIIAVRAAAVNDGGDPDDIAGTIHHLVRDWTEKAHADTCKVFVSEGKSFRYDAYPDYKSNRKDKPKPAGTDWAKEYMLDQWKQEVPNSKYEADDRMGLYATEETDEVRIIVSTDKDMRQVPAWQVSPDHHRFPWKPTLPECHRMRAMQTLCGDSVDGYPGIKGFGPAAFEKMVRNWEENYGWVNGWDEWSEIILAEYATKDLPSKTQLHCATILHHQLEPEYLPSINELYGC
jgi:5'-3' exonuclease